MKAAIIVAGGQGKRASAELGIKKQFYKLRDGREIFLHALSPFVRDKSFDVRVLVIPDDEKERTAMILRRENLDGSVEVATGGITRQESVKAGLLRLGERPGGFPDDGIVFIHDGDRPLLSGRMLERLSALSAEHEAIVPYAPVSDSLISFEDDSYADRTLFGLAQTPQVFRYGLIRAAFESAKDGLFTDEGSLVLSFGHKVFFARGEASNIKVTEAVSLKEAEALLVECSK